MTRAFASLSRRARASTPSAFSCVFFRVGVARGVIFATRFPRASTVDAAFARAMRVFDVPEPRARPRDDVASPGPPGRRRVARPTPRGRENDGEIATSSDDDATDDDSTSESDDADDENCGASERRARYRSVAGAGDGAQCCVVGADGVARGVWRATLFAEDDARDDDASVEDAFRALVARKERPWVVVLARGGHFAASAFDAREIGEEGDARASAAKRRATASRYVVRAKAGGRQVSKDGVKNIKSAGSSMRRANERALEADMREAFASMKTELEVRDDARFRERRDDDPDDEELAPETDGARVVRVAAVRSRVNARESRRNLCSRQSRWAAKTRQSQICLDDVAPPFRARMRVELSRSRAIVRARVASREGRL